MVIGDASHSVLQSPGQSINVPRVALFRWQAQRFNPANRSQQYPLSFLPLVSVIAFRFRWTAAKQGLFRRRKPVDLLAKQHLVSSDE